MLKNMFNSVSGKRIAIFGFAFKADTGDTRESPAIKICMELLEERAEIVINDPKALANVKSDLKAHLKDIICEKDPYKAAKGAHAIAVLTEWQQYKEIDYSKIIKSMHKPAFIFDGRNILDHNSLYKIGFNVFPIGKIPLKHF